MGKVMLIETQSLLTLLQSAEAYLYFRRDWYDLHQSNYYREADAVVWWQKSGRCRCCCFVAEEQAQEDIIPVELINRSIESGNFQHILDTVVSLGALELTSQIEPTSTSHFDDTIGIKTLVGQPHCFSIKAGKHHDARADKILQIIMDNAPELENFYKLKFS